MGSLACYAESYDLDLPPEYFPDLADWSRGGPFAQKTYVKVNNYVNTELTVHCKSKDDDLRVQGLAPKGSWGYWFGPNVLIESTLFYCSFVWADQLHSFDKYVEQRDDYWCDNCIWRVYPEGPCLHFAKTSIEVYNYLNANLVVHCKSKDDDLAAQTLAPGGSWGFRFRPNVFIRTTLFYCSFAWADQLHYFNIYVEVRDEPQCKDCIWRVYPEGRCRHETDHDECYRRNSPKHKLLV